MYAAHTTDDGRIQTIAEHSTQTAKRCRDMAVDPLKDLLYKIGLTHDIGKYQPRFQKKILQNLTLKVPHALCGAQAWNTRYGGTAYSRIAQYVIAGHHGGLPNCGSKMDSPDDATLFGTLKRPCGDYSAFQADLPDYQPDFTAMNAFLSEGLKTYSEAAERFAFFTRYCFSCLTDADWLDTEQFCTGSSRQPLTADFAKCLDSVKAVLSGFRCVTPLQKARADIQKQVFDKADTDGKLFLMNMPTGSGKTLAALRFALERAIRGGKRRIIFIIPYNSIIDQTAETLQQILGENATILRHQSSYVYEDSEDGEEGQAQKMKLATENWDAQIILTTAVQFFESVYSNRRSKLRKLHNMADSILVFDEAHLMPLNYLQPCLQAVAHIVKFLNSEALFLTATMPDYHKLMAKLTEPEIPIVDLVTDRSQFGVFRKCEFHSIGTVSDETLLEDCREQASALIVVNKRAAAAQLYQAAKMRGVGACFHLSTYMTQFDRKRVLSQIGQALPRLEEDYPGLKNVPPARRILVVSTSLIEAGVDLDFAMVCRELCGLDSILQAGGRCNREGRRDHARVLIFERAEDSNCKLSPAASLAKGLLKKYPSIDSSDCIEEYYHRYLDMQEEDLVKNSLGRQCPKCTQIPFRDYADKFELIDSNTISVAVEQDERSAQLLAQLRETKAADLRALQLYTFSLHRYELDALLKQGVIEDVNGVCCLTATDYYSPETGVCFTGKDYIL